MTSPQPTLAEEPVAMPRPVLLLVPGLMCDAAVWQAQCAGVVTGQAVPAGHFIPEQLPGETAEALRSFMR